MGITERHKKPGGFKKLVRSLETTPADKREKILEVMRKEDPDFTSEVERCLFHFDEFLNLDDGLLAEVTAVLTEMRTLAFALYKYKQELHDKFAKCLKPAQRFELKDCMESLESEKISKGQQASAQHRIVEKARQLEESGSFILKKYSSAYRD